MASKNEKPNIVWLEGLLSLYEAPFPHDPGDPREFGFGLGQQIVGLYVAEMLLKYALDSWGGAHGQHHNLHELFRNLPRHRRRAVERKYRELLNETTEWTWDVSESVDSFLRYLGENAITDTRYYWEPNRTHLNHFASILIAPRMLHPLIYALFIVLHNYPSQPILKRYETVFLSLAESMEENHRRSENGEESSV